MNTIKSEILDNKNCNEDVWHPHYFIIYSKLKKLKSENLYINKQYTFSQHLYL